jgi:hypothetical protein
MDDGRREDIKLPSHTRQQETDPQGKGVRLGSDQPAVGRADHQSGENNSLLLQLRFPLVDAQ